MLVVESADSSLRYDRESKQRVYARCGIPEYWIDNLVDECLEIYRDPAGDGYRSRETLRRGDFITPLAAPLATIAVVDLLP